MSEENIYVLLGSTGEYSDRSEWVVCAYSNEADANADCAALTKLAEGLEKLSWSERDAAVAERLRPHDPDASADYTGVWYSVTTCPIYGKSRISAATTQEGTP